MRTIVKALLFLGALACSQAAGGDPSPDPFVNTARYNTFPWTFQADYAYAFGVAPLLKAPTNPPAWQQQNALPGFSSGPGLLVVLRYTDSPIGAYSELFYSPGMYKSLGCPFEKPLSSVQRIWVSSPFSQRAGRNIWGIPKELATFDWQEAAGAVTVTVNDTSGKTFFRATLTTTPLPQMLTSIASSVVDALLDGCLHALQWPIDDNTNQTAYAKVPVYATCQAAAAATPPTPVKSPVCFNVKDGTVTKINNAFLDSNTFTGRPWEKVFLGPLGYRLPADIQATLGVPVPMKCWR